MKSRMSSLRCRRPIFGALAASLVISGLAGFTAAPARADDRDARDREHHEAVERREHDRAEYREHRERHYVPPRPAYVYAPPPVYVPPPPAGINLVFPIEIR